ncbi:MAG: hypothetical protein ACJARS_001149 [bacterium]|jgi:hypothetical protein
MTRAGIALLILSAAACRETVRIGQALPETDPTYRWSFVLERVVTEDGYVDYERLWHHREDLDEYLSWLAYSPPVVADASRKSQWINAHNAFVLHSVLYTADTRTAPPQWPASPPNDTRFQYDLDKDWVTPSQIRHAYLRGYSQDPRVAGALIDGTRSGPPLRPYTYTDFDLDDELDEQMRWWVNDPDRGVVVVGGQVQVPQELTDTRNDIYRWTPGDSVCEFAALYADTELATGLRSARCELSPRERDGALHHQTRPDRVQHRH